MKRFITFLSLITLLATAPLGTVQAATTARDNNKGLSITPLRQFPKVNAGSSTKSTFTIANLTSRELTVKLSVKEFSVADYTYDYSFDNPKNDWLKLGLTAVALAPSQSLDIPYTITIPTGTAPGGHYYTLFASTTLSTSGLPSTVQATVLVYLIVNGKLVKTSRLQQSSLQHFAFGKQVAYSLDPINTGNVYYSIFVSGKLHGLFTKNNMSPITHMLLPDAVRKVTGTIPSPPLPGIYKATYGYQTDSGTTVTRSGTVIFIPPWFIAFLLVLILMGNYFYRHKKTKSKAAKT